MIARSLLAVLSLSVAACSGIPHDATSDGERFRSAAVSWVGASLEDMVAVWGEPTQHMIRAAPDRNGLVRWRNTGPGGQARRADGNRCVVDARYAFDRTILRVDTISHGCDALLSDRLGRLAYRPD